MFVDFVAEGPFFAVDFDDGYGTDGLAAKEDFVRFSPDRGSDLGDGFESHQFYFFA